MNEFERLTRMSGSVKAAYPKGTRILLIKMGDDDPRPIPPNTRGTVDLVDDMAMVHCTFDNGRRLGLAYGVDSYRKLTEQELAEEKLNSAKVAVADKEMFCIDADMGIFEGYHMGQVWNGWLSPHFTKNVAEQICKAFEHETVHFSYDAERDCFIAKYLNEDYESEYKGEDFNINGKLKHLYPIGSEEWTWSKATQEEIEDENNAICVEETTDELLDETESSGQTMGM